jgi:ComEC/Rec2-related protein
MVGIIVGEVMYPFDKLFRLIPTVLSLLAVIGLFSFSKTRKFGYMAVALLVGIVAMCGANDIYDMRQVPDGNTTIQATVDSEIVVEDGMTAFYVKDVVYENKILDGRAYVRVSGDDKPDFGAGDVVVIYGNFEFVHHEWFDSFYSVAVGKQTYYNMWGTSVYKVADGRPDFPLNLQLSIKQMFYENTDGDTAMICQALVLGDKFGIDDNLYDGIKASGLAHVLAVSGLHITALASALMYLLKKIKIKPIISFVVVSVLTFVYVMLCGFTASAIRALVMTMVLNFGYIKGLKYDKLSSLSLAPIMLLMFRTQSFMHVGFLLSVFAVLGIFTYQSTFKNVFVTIYDKVGLGKKLKSDNKAVTYAGKMIGKGWNRVGDVVSVSLSANVMTTPIVACFFKSVPVLFVLSNLLILPYLMFIYIILLVITLFCQLTSLWGLSVVMQYLLVPFRLWTGFVGGLSWSSIDVSVSVFFIIAWIVSAILCSKFVFIKRRAKAVAVVIWLAIFASLVATAVVLSA